MIIYVLNVRTTDKDGNVIELGEHNVNMPDSFDYTGDNKPLLKKLFESYPYEFEKYDRANTEFDVLKPKVCRCLVYSSVIEGRLFHSVERFDTYNAAYARMMSQYNNELVEYADGDDNDGDDTVLWDTATVDTYSATLSREGTQMLWSIVTLR